jgi:hypothetical protein
MGRYFNSDQLNRMSSDVNKICASLSVSDPALRDRIALMVLAAADDDDRIAMIESRLRAELAVPPIPPRPSRESRAI